MDDRTRICAGRLRHPRYQFACTLQLLIDRVRGNAGHVPDIAASTPVTKDEQLRELDRRYRLAKRALFVEFLIKLSALVGAVLIFVILWQVGTKLYTMATHHKYSDVPGMDHPYCPPDPRECG